MLQLLWNMFRETGRINVYLFYKALEKESVSGETEEEADAVPEKNAPEVAGGNTVMGLRLQIKDPL
ncbi:YqzL family protein [Eubacteriales bacterium mix99]